jgi:hypothetical protein
MRRAVTAVAVLVAVATALAGVAAAGPIAAKQRVSIVGKGASGFVLTPLTAGPLERDAGRARFCCWKTRTIVRDGQEVWVNTGHEMTLVGKQGTLVARNRMEIVAVSDGLATVAGTWTFVRGTGDYAGLVGGGRVAGVVLPSGEWKWRRDGLLGPR